MGCCGCTPKMGCCGCSFYTSAIVAAVFGVLESITGVISSIVLFQHVSMPEAKMEKISSEFTGIMISTLVINIFWFLSTILLILGIIRKSAMLHKQWVWATSIVMMCDLLQTMVLIIVLVRDCLNHNANSFTALTFTVLLICCTRGTIIFWIANICLTIYTAHRATEIRDGPQPQPTTVVIYGGQPTHIGFAGQEMIVNPAGSSSAPPAYDYNQAGELEAKGHRPNMPRTVQGGTHVIHADSARLLGSGHFIA